MKALIFACLLAPAIGGFIRKEFNVGTDDRITLVINEDQNSRFDDMDFPEDLNYRVQDREDEDEYEDYDDEEDNDKPPPDYEDEEEDEDSEEEYDRSVPDITEHNCKTIYQFVQPADPKVHPRNLEPSYIGKNMKYVHKARSVTQYNHAYGIPIFGEAHIKPETMKRACYLVRYLMADNEGFRRLAYAKGMQIHANRGGFCTGMAPDVGNGGLSCGCIGKFPIRQIYTAAHEIAHWWINRVGDPMEKAGYIKLPEFENNESWQFKKNFRVKRQKKSKNPTPGSKCEEYIDNKANSPWKDYLYNSLKQDLVTVYRPDNKPSKQMRTGIKCGKTHHYFIYTGEDNYLGFQSGGQPKANLRTRGHDRNPNLFRLLDQVWPCGNTYISVCEDAAHGFTKGLAQKLKIGKSDPNDPSKMICDEENDKAEIPDTDVEPLSPIPAEDVEGARCLDVLKRGTEMGIPWIVKKKKMEDLDVEALQASLEDSNERAWWLRKCCATTAQFNKQGP